MKLLEQKTRNWQKKKTYARDGKCLPLFPPALGNLSGDLASFGHRFDKGVWPSIKPAKFTGVLRLTGMGSGRNCVKILWNA